MLICCTNFVGFQDIKSLIFHFTYFKSTRFQLHVKTSTKNCPCLLNQVLELIKRSNFLRCPQVGGGKTGPSEKGEWGNPTHNLAGIKANKMAWILTCPPDFQTYLRPWFEILVLKGIRLMSTLLFVLKRLVGIVSETKEMSCLIQMPSIQ